MVAACNSSDGLSFFRITEMEKTGDKKNGRCKTGKSIIQ